MFLHWNASSSGHMSKVVKITDNWALLGHMDKPHQPDLSSCLRNRFSQQSHMLWLKKKKLNALKMSKYDLNISHITLAHRIPAIKNTLSGNI